ncbi:MAG: RimK/LysX family protein [Candidatus Saccharibacteria bacterium]|nr:RimK/LysX family protein [Candidatus Saccharibacteria bacterium]
MVTQKSIIGRNVSVDFGYYGRDIPAKIDTGADSSSVWASNIRVGRDGALRFTLFGEGSPYYTGKVIKRTDFSVAQVRSSSGHEQVRYRTHFTVTVKGRRIKAMFNLSDRSDNLFPVLIGRRTLAGKFIVDVQEGDIAANPSASTESHKLRSELVKDPHAFYKKYHQKGSQE